MPNEKTIRPHQFTFYTLKDSELQIALRALQDNTDYNFSAVVRTELEPGLKKKFPQLFPKKGK